MADVLKVSILGKESIHCGFHLKPYIAQTVLTTLPSSTYVLITDTNVAKHHLQTFQDEFFRQMQGITNKDARFLSHVIPPGETTKSREGKAEVEDFLLLNKCTRDTVILALGGGVIGDLVGFVAATFMRGVRFVQIPTTLLAMVDSSVGGKTAIDTPHGKNLIGAFWQPEYIFIDAAFLETLPGREFSNGMAEVVKTAAIWNESEFASLESRSAEIFSAALHPTTTTTTTADGTEPLFAGRAQATRTPSQQLLLSIIVGSISVKAYIVTIDERETGLRNLVNFGHTIGHAIEAVLTPTILHGECVSIGMVLEAEVARQLGILSQVAVGRITRCLKAYNLPVSLDDPRISGLEEAKGLTVDRLLDVMSVDKKNAGKEKKVVLLKKIGETFEQKATGVKDEVIRKTLANAVEVVPGIPRNSPVTMTTPGSKSISNRALVLAALGKGTCRLKNLLHSDDTQVMMAALMDLKGASFEWEDGGETLVVTGGQGSLSLPPKGKELYLGNAGTAARFLTTVCTLVQPPSPMDDATTTIITGNARMKQRPIGPLVNALRENGSAITYLETPSCLPLSIPPNSLKSGHIKLSASISSQYVSSILLCAPYAYTPAPEDGGGEEAKVVLELTGGQVISQPYIDMTIGMMRSFGVDVVRRTDPSTGALLDVYEIPSGKGKGYTNPEVYAIESDASSATYPLAVAAITGTECRMGNIGSGSVQGDAGFARNILERMGCVVEQSEGETVVRGPEKGGLGNGGMDWEVDMETMTDAFLTAAVLGAVVEGGRMRIRGIANQRVKECNRIKAMMDELAKFGVETRELEDGLEVFGKRISELKKGVRVHCYDDHRVAMAFSVLACVVEGTIIEEKRCVEKTWPNWWDDLENKIGITVRGIDLSTLTPTPSSSSSSTATSLPLPSILLIGMRGSGKTYIASLASTTSTQPLALLDADAYFEIIHKTSVREYVHTHGWAAFRAAETAVLRSLVDPASPTSRGHIISLGGGIVETPEARGLLKAYVSGTGGSVVHVMRPIEEIERYLGEEVERPAYGEPVRSVFERRKEWFEECSNFEFGNQVVVGGETAEQRRSREVEVGRFFNHVLGVAGNQGMKRLGEKKRTYFLSLTYPDLKVALPIINSLTEGVDAIEVRVDLLREPGVVDSTNQKDYIPSRTYVTDQIAALRLATSLPIIFTLRSVAQGGSFPDVASQGKQGADLLRLGLRLGVEYLDLETSLPTALLRELTERKGATQIIASWHDWTGTTMKWTGEVVKKKYQECDKWGDIIKIVGTARDVQVNFDLYRFVQSHTSNPSDKPFIAINMGAQGQMSRILNHDLTPVSHPQLPFKAAPGQLSFKQIQQALHLLGQSPAKQFYLLGTPIAHSFSPMLHNTAFEHLGLPHRYQLLETASVTEGEDRRRIQEAVVMDEEGFGGASVTIPFKLDVIKLLDELTPAAKVIGAVNTIIPVISEDDGASAVNERRRKRKLLGDNTDWQGILACLHARLPKPSTSTTEKPTALVIGAGGTARAAIYALQAYGVSKIYLYNRTSSKCQDLVDAFPNGPPLEVINGVGSAGFEFSRSATTTPPSIIVSTVPASAFPSIADVPKGLFGVTKRNGGSVSKPLAVLVDMAYGHGETSLIGAALSEGWAAVPGLDVLLEQGYRQFELWTGLRCPREVVDKRVREFRAAPARD